MGLWECLYVMKEHLRALEKHKKNGKSETTTLPVSNANAENVNSDSTNHCHNWKSDDQENDTSLVQDKVCHSNAPGKKAAKKRKRPDSDDQKWEPSKKRVKKAEFPKKMIPT
ncbi:hypothetical protein RFI_14516 [Reticulomyxa filosa]|uniref:Uncharacterized protein n=1 Tax=Reticulomyxa filosa TaxID=46433 RepID=X6N8Q3_RETFI|nr:hypothetical protein RFI_14516 [Reticulomyxa filosa]|eukprot:ETO22675.1 hypothetical protein RFI_14516 [Reticulomyxa filosa]